jgi:hypothetical protein
MNNLRQAAQRALKAMEDGEWRADMVEFSDALIALRAALAEPQTTHWEGCEAVHPECKERVMDRELLIQLAQETIFDFPNEDPFDFTLKTLQQRERFAALVAAHEREACAQIAKQWDIDHPSTNYGGCIAAAIRSRT